MLTKVTTLSVIEVQPVQALVELSPSTEYLVNTDNIVRMRLYNTTDTLIEYVFNKKDDQSLPEEIIVDEVKTAIQTASDVDADSAKVALSVFPNAQSFSEVAFDTAETMYFNVSNIVWAEDNASETYARILVEYGGFGLKIFFVDCNIDQIYDLVTTGTTTTTTSSTSTTTSS